jgi:hypothetical protein
VMAKLQAAAIDPELKRETEAEERINMYS